MTFFFNVVSSIRDANIDPTKYTIRRQLNERLVLYARIVGVSGYSWLVIIEYQTYL